MRCVVIFSLVCLITMVGRAEDEGQPQVASGVAEPGEWTNSFKVKREEVFEFARKPQVTREGDRVRIAFESKGFCDVTVAIEDANGRILRHLASGVLGDNAPEPFMKDSKTQMLVWDGKDDTGVYIDDKNAISVRVSLGLKPQFERTLFWHHGKSAGEVMLFEPTPEGILVFRSGRAVDHLQMMDRDGNYLRTIYPFPNAKLGNIPDLIRHRFPDGVELPIKPNWQQSSLLMSGSNCTKPTYQNGRYSGYGPRGTELYGSAAFAMGAAGERIALTADRLSRLAMEGSSGGLNLHGPSVALGSDKPLWTPKLEFAGSDALSAVRARRIALSPDGKWIYLTMYNETYAGSGGTVIWRHMVQRMRYDGNEPPVLFAGGETAGARDGQFNMPTDVACDSRGRVYVADHMNNRVQVFDADGKFVRSIATDKPSRISLHHKTGEIFVFSWAMPHQYGGFRGTIPSIMPRELAEKHFRLTQFSALDEARKLGEWDLQKQTGLTKTRASNVEIHAAVDTWADPLRVWITAPSPVKAKEPRGRGLVRLDLEEGEWVVKRDLLQEAHRSISRVSSAMFNRQRLYVNPADGMLYVAEGDSSHGKAFLRALRIDPDTGRTREVELPMSAEDMAFDRDGHLYLRTSEMIVRYASDTLREIPFDYGEERDRHHFGGGGGERSGRVLSGALFPGNKGFHQGGMYVSPDGHIVVAALYLSPLKGAKDDTVSSGAKPFQPIMYPGRRWIESGHGGLMVHVLNRHGRIVHADAVPGLHNLANGTGLDSAGDVYLLNPSPRIFDGKVHFNDHAGTLMKFTPGKGRLLAPGETPVPLKPTPERAADLAYPKAWVEGAHWMYAGVGWGGQNFSSGCSCPNARFALDYFGRSFTPEIDRYNVGVLDRNGNLILRVGRPGSVDEGMPLVKDGGPANPRSIGGDETAIFFAPYVAVHTDRRLFVADPGNARVAGVKLGYHAEEKVALKDVPDEAKP